MAVTKIEEPVVEPEPEQVELLTVENHPTLGQRQQWRMSDGTVREFWFTPTLRPQT